MKAHPSDRLSAERQQALFSAAVQEFSSRGFKQASLNRIIAETGMSKSSFYHFFANKADLFHRTLDHCTAPYVAGLAAYDPTCLQAENFWSELQSVMRAQTLMANASSEIGLVVRMLQRALDDPEEKAFIADLMETTTHWLAALIRRGQQLGLVRNDLPETLLIATIMGFSMSFDQWIFARWDELSDDERLTLADAGADAYRRLLEAKN